MNKFSIARRFGSTKSVRLSPAARHIIESKNLDTANITGTSKGGLISKSDVILALQSGKAVKSVAAANPVSVAKDVTVPPTVQPSGNYTDVPNNNMRKVIAKRLTESKATVPHFYTSIECEIDELMALRQSLKKDLDINVSVNDLVIKSAALALRDVPEANARWNKGNSTITKQDNIDISVAVATPNGLITPILTGADKRGLVNISSTVRDMAIRAKENKLKPEEFQGGTFSISNLGMFGITAFSAVINTPQSCILAVGSGVSKVLPPKTKSSDATVKPKPRVATTVTVQLSGDRRVVDEALASQFLQAFNKYLSNPKAMLL